MRKVIYTVIIFAMMGLVLTGCSSLGSSSNSKSEDQTDKKTEKEIENKDQKKKTKKKKVTIDLSSENGILSFLEGEWTLYDTDSGSDQGILSIGKNGSFEYKRLDNDAKGSGTLSFDHISAPQEDAPDYFRLAFDDVKELLPEGYELFGDEGTDGIFHIGSFEDEDHLYLKEIGNGDSIVSMYVFNPDEEYDPEKWRTEWFLYRAAKNSIDADEIKDETFYAWVWERDDSGLWLQPMKSHEYDTYGEYSNHKFRGAYFSETGDIGIKHYEFDDADLSGVLHTDRLAKDYPLGIYQVTVDDNGFIKELSDVEIAMYNVYNICDLDPEFSFDGTDFIINGAEIDMREFVPATDAIVDCIRIGDWIAVECHINPDKSVYEFYNIPNGNMSYFEYEITGAKLTWRGDDLSTAVYECDNSIYDFWGHPIASLDNNEEIGRIDIIDDTTIRADVRVYSDDGTLTEEKREYEYEPCDRAVLSYYSAMIGGDSQMKRFINDAPVNAAALIIVNPPEALLDKMPFPETYEENDFDRVVVVSLSDDQEIFIESLEPGKSGKKERSETFEMKKGECKVFEITVPEGMPLNEVVVRTSGMGEVYWDICQLSGRIPQMSTYLIAGD